MDTSSPLLSLKRILLLPSVMSCSKEKAWWEVESCKERLMIQEQEASLARADGSSSVCDNYLLTVGSPGSGVKHCKYPYIHVRMAEFSFVQQK